jgi:uncharacterized protein YbjT (DUF2867 family)
MNSGTILVAGAGGHTGKHIVPMLIEQGYSVRLLTRAKSRLAALYPKADIVEADITNAASLRGVCTGVQAVISTIGASLDMNDFRDKRSFHEIDFGGNKNLFAEAERANVQKFVYLSAFGGETTNTVYTNEHEALVQLLKKNGMKYAVVRPTGFFYVNGEFLSMAQKGRAMMIGDGSARTNPIHEADVAKACVDALTSTETSIDIGGAETFTRKEIIELAFRVLNKKPVISRAPYGVMRVASKLARPINRRLGDLVEFVSVVATKDCVAPAMQTQQRLEDYFRVMAGGRESMKDKV